MPGAPEPDVAMAVVRQSPVEAQRERLGDGAEHLRVVVLDKLEPQPAQRQRDQAARRRRAVEGDQFILAQANDMAADAGGVAAVRPSPKRQEHSRRGDDAHQRDEQTA